MKKQSKLGKVLIIIGLVLILSAVTLTLYNILDEYRANKEASKLARELEQLIMLKSYRYKPDEYDNMPEIYIDNVNEKYIGILEIPVLDLKLPVMNHWNYSKLKKAPCLYSGSIYKNNMIIAGHNYSEHFGKLDKLKQNDQIIFTDVNGDEYLYQVEDILIIDGSNVEDMNSGDWDLSLFTCNYSGQARVTIRCNKKL